MEKEEGSGENCWGEGGRGEKKRKWRRRKNIRESAESLPVQRSAVQVAVVFYFRRAGEGREDGGRKWKL